MLKFIDKYFWWCLLVIIVMVILMSLLLGNYSGMYCWFYKNAYLDNTNLVTISTVFIGIYFSLYGFLWSAVFHSLNRQQIFLFIFIKYCFLKVSRIDRSVIPWFASKIILEFLRIKFSSMSCIDFIFRII